MAFWLQSRRIYRSIRFYRDVFVLERPRHYSLGISAVFGSITAYMDLEEKLRRTNSALVSVRNLMVWWHGLSVIEKRIPSNKTMLVETMESIILAEAGSVVMGQGDGGKAYDAEGGE